MAGISEASAIIAVAQAGISLSMVIIAYVGDVRDAPKSISRIGNEIKSTSGRLEEIAEVIRDNPNTRLLLDTAVGDATRCSSECELILAQVGNLLVKGGWKRDSTGLSKNDIDTSVVASLRWPFLKTRLDTPRVELQRIKADLILLFTVAMARKSSTPLTNEYARKIPLLTKKKEEAARRAEEARHKARQGREDNDGTWTRSPRAPSRRVPQMLEEEPDLSQQFWEFELQRAKEQEERKFQERAALLQAENDERQRSEEDRQREIARKAIEGYKLQQEELKAKTAAREKQLSDELFALGLGPEQVASVLAVPSLNVDETHSHEISRRKSTESQRTSLSEVSRKPKPQRKRRSSFAIKFFPWRGNRGSKSYNSGSHSLESISDRNGVQYNRGIDDQESIELWLVDVFSRQHTELAPSERWLSQKLEKVEKSNDIWHRFGQLQPMWRVAVQDFLKAKNEAQTPEHAWKLIHIGLPRRMTKISFFGHNHQGQLVRLIISRRQTANQGVDCVFVDKREEEETFQSTVKIRRTRARTYLPRQLISTSVIREYDYNYEERFDAPSNEMLKGVTYRSHIIIPLLKGVTYRSHIMIPQDLTLKQVNTLAGLTKSYMESGRVPWAAQPLFTYTVIENDVPDHEQDRLYDHTDPHPGEAPGVLTPAHRHLENHQQGSTEDRGPRVPSDFEGDDKRSFGPRRATPGEPDVFIPKKDRKVYSEVIVEDPIQQDERRVVFKDQQPPSHYTGYGKNGYGPETDDREVIFSPRENSEKLMKGAKNERHKHDMQIKPVKKTRPTYIKVHRKYLSPETLDTYELPWEWSESDPNYIIIKQWVPAPDQELLFKHSRLLREEKLFIDKERSEIEKTKRNMSFEEEDTLPDGRNSQALVLRTPRGRSSSHAHPSRKSTYDDGIRVRGYDDSRSPSPSFDPYNAAKRKLSPTRPIAPPTLSKSFDSWEKPWHKYEKFSSRPPKPFPSSRFATQSRPKALESVDSGDDGEEDHDVSELAKDESGDDADLIAKTLSRYTTFKVDEEVTIGAKAFAPPADAPISASTSRSRSSTPPRSPTTLKEMKSSLEKMQITQNRAEEDGDLATVSELRYHAARSRAEAAEDEAPGASTASKIPKKAVHLSRVQWRGLLQDSPNKAQTERSGERLSHLLKKTKRTDESRNEDSAHPSIHLADPANDTEDHAAQTTKNKENQKGSSPTERLDNERSGSAVNIVRRSDRSPSESESERGPLRRADTQLYEADSEGSGTEEGTFERRYTWRRPTVEEEDEIIERHGTWRPAGEDKDMVEEQVI